MLQISWTAKKLNETPLQRGDKLWLIVNPLLASSHVGSLTRQEKLEYLKITTKMIGGKQSIVKKKKNGRTNINKMMPKRKKDSKINKRQRSADISQG